MHTVVHGIIHSPCSEVAVHPDLLIPLELVVVVVVAEVGVLVQEHLVVLMLLVAH